jgi:hypothetical protein
LYQKAWIYPIPGNGFGSPDARFGLKGIEISSREKGKALKQVSQPEFS